MIVLSISLSCMEFELYNWKDEKEFIQWLSKHPIANADDIKNSNFIDNFATWQNHKLKVDLASLLNDMKIKDVFGMNFDGFQSQE